MKIKEKIQPINYDRNKIAHNVDGGDNHNDGNGDLMNANITIESSHATSLNNDETRGKELATFNDNCNQ